MIKAASLAAVVAGSGLLLAAQSDPGSQETFRISDTQVSVYNLAGTVEVVSGSGRDFVVQVTRGGEDGDRLAVETDRVDGRSALVVQYPDDDVVYDMPGRGRYRTAMQVREDGTFGRGGRRVRIQSGGDGMDAHADLRIEVPEGGRLRVVHGVGMATVRGVDGDVELDLAHGGADVEGMRGELAVDTGSGSVVARDVRGAVEVDTGSGSVELADVYGPSVLVDTGSGSIRAARLEAGVLELDTGSGGIEVTELAAEDVSVDSGSGRVELHLVAAAESVSVDTGAGSVLLTLPRDMGAEIEVDTGSGGIDMDLPMEVTRRDRGYLRGVMGNGRGRVLVDTGSGSVRIRGS